MDKTQVDLLKKKFEEIVAGAPFFGHITHRTRAVFLAKWKEFLKSQGIHGPGYVDDLLRALGKKKGF